MEHLTSLTGYDCSSSSICIQLTLFTEQEFSQSMKLKETFEILCTLTFIPSQNRWALQRDNIEQLNIQAHTNVMMNRDEFVVQAFLSFDKIPVLVHELLVIELWKTKVAPLIHEELGTASKGSVLPYLMNYHEATLINLLECFFFNKDAVLSNDDCVVELIDYCQRKINLLCSGKLDLPLPTSTDSKKEETDLEHYEQQKNQIDFGVALCALTVFRYITDNLGSLPPSAVTRILDTHDTTLSLVYLLEKAPWTKRAKGAKIFKYMDGRWKQIPQDDFLKLTQTEAQVWLALNNLIVDPVARRKYEYTSIRRETVIRVKRYFNEVLIDQIPILVDLQRAVEELHVSVPPESTQNKSMLIIEQVPLIRESIMKGVDWEKLAQANLDELFSQSEQEKREQMMRLAQIFSELSKHVEYGDSTTK